MVEDLRNAGAEQRQPSLIRNPLVAHTIAYAIDYWKMGRGLSPDGHRLFRKFLVKACKGERVSISQDMPRVYQGASLSVEIEGQENIPSYGPTILVANHTHGGPMDGIAQFFSMAKEGYDARTDEQDEEVREPFLIMGRGLEKGRLLQFISTKIYENAFGPSLNCEIVAIPQFDEEGEIINGQNLKISTVRRIINGASLWLPQGTHRASNDLDFPEKSTEFLKMVNKVASIKDLYIKLVPVRSIPDSQGNIKLIFGPSVESSHIVANGGIKYFVREHLAPLGRH